MIVMPFTTEMIDGTPSASGVSWRSIVGAPDVTPPACAIASPSVGTTSSDVDDSTPPLAPPPPPAGSDAAVTCSTACTTVTISPPEVCCTAGAAVARSEEHTSELQSLAYLVCRLLLEKKKKVKLTVECRARSSTAMYR